MGRAFVGHRVRVVRAHGELAAGNPFHPRRCRAGRRRRRRAMRRCRLYFGRNCEDGRDSDQRVTSGLPHRGFVLPFHGSLTTPSEQVTPPDPSDPGAPFHWHLVDVRRANRSREPEGQPQPVWFAILPNGIGRHIGPWSHTRRLAGFYNPQLPMRGYAATAFVSVSDPTSGRPGSISRVWSRSPFCLLDPVDCSLYLQRMRHELGY